MCVAPPRIMPVPDGWAVALTVVMTEDGRMVSLEKPWPLATFHGRYAELNARAFANHMRLEMGGGPCQYGPSPRYCDYGQAEPAWENPADIFPEDSNV